MKSEISLPENYAPFDKLNLCSNILLNVQIPFSIREVALLLVGKGKTPLVWLSAPTAPGSKEWEYIVESNKSLNPAIYVEVRDQEKAVSVKVGNVIIIKVVAESETTAVADIVDLRPLGINIYGDSSILNLGNNKFTQNSIVNARVAFALGS